MGESYAGRALPCEDSADLNDDEDLSLDDAIDLLTYLFRDGPAPQGPSLACGPDLEGDPLGCVSSVCP